MVALDDPGRFKEVDRSDMLGLVGRLPDLLAEGQRVAGDAKVPTSYPRKVFVCGMGGSAISGDLLAAANPNERPPQILVVRDYHLPPYVAKDDLVVAVSYSGNTEETLSCFSEAVARGCPPMAIASGGKLLEAAHKYDVPAVTVPGGLPPRGALGYLFSATAMLLDHAGAGGYHRDLEKLPGHLRRLAGDLQPSVPPGENPAKVLAAKLQGRTPIVNATPFLGPVARRWQTQLNENAKVLAWHALLPEMDHNELVGWANDDRRGSFGAVFLRDSREGPPMEARLRATQDLVGEGSVVGTFTAEGENPMERLFHLLHLGDFVSVYLALLRGVDPTPVKVIEELKGRLSRAR